MTEQKDMESSQGTRDTWSLSIPHLWIKLDFPHLIELFVHLIYFAYVDFDLQSLMKLR